MNFTEMQAECTSMIQDSSFEPSWIAAGLEAALVFVASIFPLPYLTTTGSVTFVAAEDSHAMPIDYQWNLFHAYNTTDSLKVTIWPSLKNLLDEFDYTTDQYINTQNVAVEDTTLYIPHQAESDQAIKVWYTKLSPTLDTDPNCLCIPKHLHYELLVNRVAQKAYALIEDGIEGKKVNWSFNREEFGIGLAMLRAYFPRTGEHITHIKRNSFRV